MNSFAEYEGKLIEVLSRYKSGYSNLPKREDAELVAELMKRGLLRANPITRKGVTQVPHYITGKGLLLLRREGVLA